MKTITPFKIPNEPRFELEMPTSAKILAVTIHEGIPCMWILHDQNAILTWRTFRLIPGKGFITAQQENMNYITHFKTKDNAIFIFEEI